jgi:polyhydroxyalkanoate synthesis regulator phasin
MSGFGDLVQKAFYLGVGLASYAGEQANEKLVELREKAQKLADELVARGEMNAEEARRFVDEMVRQGQEGTPTARVTKETPKEPRRIEILDEDEEETTSTSPEATSSNSQVETLHDQVRSLQEELRRLQQDR